MRKSLLMALAGMTAATVFAVPGTVVTENDSKTGDVKWSVRAKGYVISVKQGNTMIDAEVPAADVVELDIQKPATFDAAAEQVDKGNGSAAIPALKKIIDDYQHLQWDKIAGSYLARAYLDSGKAEDAYKTCRDIIAGDPSAAYKGDLAPAYWEALLKLDKKSALEGALKKAAASGDRFSSGSALIKRGDIILAEGKDSPDAAKKALTDAYLRVVLLYRDAEVAARVRPEALYKAAKCFERLSQSGRADQMRTELKSLYGSSPWASK